MIFVETEQFVDFLVQHQLTPNQFMFCYLKASFDMKNFKRYMDKVGKFKREEISDLIERGYIEDFNEFGPNGARKVFIDSYLVTPKFTKNLYIETEQAGRELWELFPDYFTINGSRVNAKSCDQDAIIKLYCKYIKNGVKLHKEVLSLLKQAVDRGEIKMGIEKWVSSKQWEILKRLFNENDGKHGIEVY